MNNPEYIKINNEKIKINTDFRVGLACQRVAQDKTISDFERALAIEYLLIGEKCFEIQDQEHLLKLLLKYLSLDEEVKNDKPDMDFMQDADLIYASFMSDYSIDIEKTDMHWWTYIKLLRGLTEDSVLNRVREIRNMDVSNYDEKTKQKILKAKKEFALKYEKPLNDNARRFYREMGIERK